LWVNVDNKYEQNTCPVFLKTVSDNPKGKIGHSNQNLGFVGLELRLAKQFLGRSMVNPRSKFTFSRGEAVPNRTLEDNKRI
jgi:hypothetical protein